MAAKFGGLYTTHIRGEGENRVRAISEAIEIAEKAGLPCHILDFKGNGQANWGRMPEIVKLIQAARDRGVDITANQYPHPEGRNYELARLASAERR